MVCLKDAMNPSHDSAHTSDRWATALLVIWGVFLLGPHVTAAGPYSVDMSELTLCAWVGGVPHSPGYPLWTMLAELAIMLQPTAEPIHAIGRMGVLLACLASLVTQRLLRQLGSGIWAATAAAGLLFVIPLSIRAFSIPEVLSLDLLLIAGSLAAIHRGQETGAQGWTGLGAAITILAIGHRPINLILILVVSLGFRFDRTQLRGLASGLAAGITAQALLYMELWSRIHDPAVRWVDEHALTTLAGFGRFVVGLPFEKFFLWAPNEPHFIARPLELGLQVTALVSVTVLAPLLIRPRRLGWMLIVMACWHLLFISIYNIADREFLFFPVVWTGVLCVGLSVRYLNPAYRSHAGKMLLAMALVLSVINQRGLVKTGHSGWQEEFRTVLSEVPADAILLSDDWKARTGLVATREMEGVGPGVDVVRISLEGGDIQRLYEWFQGEAPLVLLEESREITDIRPIRVHDGRLIPLLIDRGLITSPAEAGTWSVTPPSKD